jgi:cytochrome c556
MKIKVLSLFIAASISAAVPAVAIENPIQQRQDAMKAIGAATKATAAMIKGQDPYDPAKAELAFRKMNEAATQFGTLFPEGSETGMDTEASPKIWENLEDFQTKVDQFEADTREAIKMASQGEDAFKAAFGQATKNCKACHSEYRISKR